MENNVKWLDRLLSEVEKSELSDRQISVLSGIDPSYINKFKKKPKDLGTETLLKICKTLEVSPIYIITGANITPAHEELLKSFSNLNDEQQTIIIQFMSTIT